MPEAKQKAEKSRIPKRIRSRIEEAFASHLNARSRIAGDDAAAATKAEKKAMQDAKDVLAYVEGLLADKPAE